MDLIREILAAHESGISRDGLLAWARLRGDPKMTDEQLEQALVALGDEVVDVQGFLYLSANAPAGATSTPAAAASSGWAGATETPPPPPPPPGWAAPGPTPSSGWAAETPPPAAPDAWTTPEPVPVGEATDWASSEAQAWTTPQTGSRRSMIVAGVAVAGFVVIAAVASFLLRATDDSNPPVATPSSGTVIGAETLQVGDCVILPSEDTFDELRRLSCTEPHDGEIFFVGDHPDGDFPGNDGFETFVTASCEPAFENYTGSSFFEQEVLEYGWFTPTEGSWQSGDREVSCYLTPTEGLTSRSWRDANP